MTMDSEEKRLLHRVDEKVDSLDSKVDTVQKDVRANRDVFNNRLRKESKKIDETEDIARANRVRQAGLATGVVILLTVLAGSAGLFPV